MLRVAARIFPSSFLFAWDLPRLGLISSGWGAVCTGVILCKLMQAFFCFCPRCRSPFLLCFSFLAGASPFFSFFSFFSSFFSLLAVARRGQPVFACSISANPSPPRQTGFAAEAPRGLLLYLFLPSVSRRYTPYTYRPAVLACP